jgi:hypothetical protein
MKQIFYPYYVWECYKNNMYLTKDENEEENIKKVIYFFNTEDLFFLTCIEVFKNYKYTLKHHLTDNGINKIAYLGQVSCNYKFNIPEITIKKAWFLLSNEIQIKSNKIAENLIKIYFKNETENRQLYLKLE